jgi:hypothetical protein
MGMAELNRGSASTRQVTTATPARLDFRETGISIEGFVNAMSTGSALSVAPAHHLWCASEGLPPRSGGKTGRLLVAEDLGLPLARLRMSSAPP